MQAVVVVQVGVIPGVPLGDPDEDGDGGQNGQHQGQHQAKEDLHLVCAVNFCALFHGCRDVLNIGLHQDHLIDRDHARQNIHPEAVGEAQAVYQQEGGDDAGIEVHGEYKERHPEPGPLQVPVGQHITHHRGTQHGDQHPQHRAGQGNHQGVEKVEGVKDDLVVGQGQFPRQQVDGPHVQDAGMGQGGNEHVIQRVDAQQHHQQQAQHDEAVQQDVVKPGVPAKGVFFHGLPTLTVQCRKISWPPGWQSPAGPGPARS